MRLKNSCPNGYMHGPNMVSATDDLCVLQVEICVVSGMVKLNLCT